MPEKMTISDIDGAIVSEQDLPPVFVFVERATDTAVKVFAAHPKCGLDGWTGYDPLKHDVYEYRAHKRIPSTSVREDRF